MEFLKISSDCSCLFADREKVVLGRGPLTKVKDKKCSREQVEIIADYESQEIELIQIGKNPSAIGTILINQGGRHVLGPGGVFSFLEGKHRCSVQFIDVSQPPMKANIEDIDDSSKDSQWSLTMSTDTLKDNETLEELKNFEKNQATANKTPDTCPRKRKSDENEASKPSSLKKLRRSLTGHLTDCFTTEEFRKTDLNGIECKSIRKLEEVYGEASELKDKVIDTSEMNAERGIGDVPFQGSGMKATPKVAADKWTTQDGLMVFSAKGLQAKHKIAGFDLDGTLITTISGKVFATGADDWKLLFGNTKSKLKTLYDEGYKITVFTNQKGLGKGKVSVEGFKHKIAKIQDRLSFPLQCFVATSTDKYRKPVTGMWQALQANFNSGIEIDMQNSFYVGDAAGRPVGWSKGKKKDFSCADRGFADNLGLKFHTPEEFFLNWNQATFSWPSFNPKKIPRSPPLLHPSCAMSEILKSNQEIVLMVGFPACGKTTFAKNHFVANGYEHVNRDTLSTWQKCVASCRAAVSKGKSVVVDNTNPDKSSRKRYIEVASEKQIPVRCFIMTTSLEHSQFNNKFRELTTNDKSYKPVGPIAFHSYKNSYEEPHIDEGFQEIVKVNFIPRFSDKNKEKLYFSFL